MRVHRHPVRFLRPTIGRMRLGSLFKLAGVLMLTSFTHTLMRKRPRTQARKRPSHKHPDRNYVHLPVEMPVLSTNPGRFGVSDALSHLSSADCGPTKTRKESRPSLSASLVREQDVKQYAGLMVLQSHLERRKSRYDKMVAVEDSIRGDESHDLAHPVLVLVRMSTL